MLAYNPLNVDGSRTRRHRASRSVSLSVSTTGRESTTSVFEALDDSGQSDTEEQAARDTTSSTPCHVGLADETDDAALSLESDADLEDGLVEGGEVAAAVNTTGIDPPSDHVFASPTPRRRAFGLGKEQPRSLIEQALLFDKPSHDTNQRFVEFPEELIAKLREVTCEVQSRHIELLTQGATTRC